MLKFRHVPAGRQPTSRFQRSAAILSTILGLVAIESALLLYYLSSWLTLPLVFGAGI